MSQETIKTAITNFIGAVVLGTIVVLGAIIAAVLLGFVMAGIIKLAVDFGVVWFTFIGGALLMLLAGLGSFVYKRFLK